MNRNQRICVLVWLAVVCLVIISVVVVGGITRLTESGLSIVDWRPLMGVVPPLTDDAWDAAFAQYQDFPEYRLLKPGMELSEFKSIFFWEYLHRMLARFSGLIFLVPYLYFLARGYFDRVLAARIGVAFFLGGLQGLLGWYMVKSGLASNPHVSHYRLAAHLALALFLFSYLLWIAMDLLAERREPPGADGRAAARAIRPWAMGLLALVAVQIIYGAFVAGLDAGYLFNTFPRMLGRWWPPGMTTFEPVWINFLQNATAVQWVHRALGWVIFFGAYLLALRGRRLSLARSQQRLILAVAVATTVQFLLGVLTLILVVPVPVAAMHQLFACVLLATTVALTHDLCVSPGSST